MRVAIVGVGNCASALVQGIAIAKAYHRKLEGVTFEDIGGYKPRDIDIVACFDVDERKVNLKLKDAIFAEPNCCMNLLKYDEINFIDHVVVQKTKVLDGVAPHMLEHPKGFKVDFEKEELKSYQVRQILRERKVDVLINYLPVGSQVATEYWANICIDTKIAFCNCIPVFIASNPEWEQKFIRAGLPLIGDDMRSQFGASVLSQMLQELAFDRGHKVKAHIQQNVGGNTDFLNMVDRSRLKSKKISKENVIRAQNVLRSISDKDSFLFAGPSDFIEHYGDNKIATFRLELEGFGGAPVTLDAKLSVQDSPNSAGVVIDAIRFLKVAREMGVVGSLRGASAFTQKTPPEQLTFADARYECNKLAHREITERMITITELAELCPSSDST